MSAQPAPVLLVSPDMRPSVMGVARSLAEAGLLRRFVTTVAFGDGVGPAGFDYLPASWRAKLRGRMARRELPGSLGAPVETLAAQELVNLAARRLRLGEVACHHVWEWTETTFDRRVAERWAGRAPCIYGCEHASVETFRRQKRAGGYNVLWQVIAHHRTAFRLLREEYDAYPEAVTPYLRRLFRTAPRVNGRKDEQYASADLIVTNSEFARETFIEAGVPAGKVKAVPTGCPPTLGGVVEEGAAARSPMVFLCAGSLSLRKGVQYLLAAWRRLPPTRHAELWLVGRAELPSRLLRDLPPNVTVRPPVPRAGLEEIFRQSSVLVLPTLVEGLAHVVLEALSAGLAVITTENSGCGALVEDGVNGWKVPIRDAEALAERIAWCVDNPAGVADMRRRSLHKAAAWQERDFARTHAGLIESFLGERGLPGAAGAPVNRTRLTA